MLCVDTFSTGSVYNLYTEKAEEDGEIESPTAAQQTLENTVTMKKMKQLKAKMENMNLSRKVGLEVLCTSVFMVHVGAAGSVL